LLWALAGAAVIALAVATNANSRTLWNRM